MIGGDKRITVCIRARPRAGFELPGGGVGVREAFAIVIGL
jgi:hypothetical protein